MSTTFCSGTTFFWLAKRVSSDGLGAAARSGGSPAATSVVRTASWSRVATNWTSMPVCCSKGARTALKESSSPSDQTPRMVTVPPLTELEPLLVAPGAQAAPMSRAMMPNTSPRLCFKTCIPYPQLLSLLRPISRSYSCLLTGFSRAPTMP